MKELSKLKGRIREKGTNYRFIAKEIGMALTTFNNKINGYSDFDIIEASKIALLLDIPPDQILYFFT